jgi:hypothetical protein
MIPFYKIKTTNYPCENSGMILQAITFVIAFIFMLAMCIFAYRNGEYLGVVIIFVLFLLSILLINIVIIYCDRKIIRQILQILQNSSSKNDVKHIGEYLEYKKGRRIHYQLRLQPEILLLIGKIYKNYYQDKGMVKEYGIAIDLIKISVEYDPTLESIAEIDDLSNFSVNIFEKINFTKRSYFIILLNIFFTIILWMIVVFLIMMSIINIINVIVKLL